MIMEAEENENKRYHFVKISSIFKTDNESGQERWCFVPKDRGQMLEHYNKICLPIIEEGVKEITDDLLKYEHLLHYKNSFSILASTMISCGMSPIKALKKAINDTKKRFDMTQYGKIFLFDTLSFTVANSMTAVIEERDLDTLSYPIDDSAIKVIKWPGGTHFYAKVGSEDVVWDGEQKWNSRSEARKAAELWLEERHKR